MEKGKNGNFLFSCIIFFFVYSCLCANFCIACNIDTSINDQFPIYLKHWEEEFTIELPECAFTEDGVLIDKIKFQYDTENESEEEEEEEETNRIIFILFLLILFLFIPVVIGTITCAIYSYYIKYKSIVDNKIKKEILEVICLKEEIKQLKEKNEENEDMNMCKICLYKPKDSIIVPCGHFHFCMSCVEALRSDDRVCPYCRKPISFGMKVYQ
jgi:hypothetical protein